MEILRATKWTNIANAIANPMANAIANHATNHGLSDLRHRLHTLRSR
jgi:hypothetical protein